MSIIKSAEHVYPIAHAEALAAELNAEADDDWTYAVESGRPGYARVAAYDEDGILVAYF